jgi:hypothetical protein
MRPKAYQISGWSTRAKVVEMEGETIATIDGPVELKRAEIFAD